MTKTTLLILMILFCLNSCNSPSSLPQQLKNLSNDSLYISQDCTWQIADTSTIDMDLFDKKNPMTAEVELVKFDKDSLFLISTSAVKTSDDSIYLFNPPDNGGELVAGKLINQIIKSHAKQLNRKIISWLPGNSFKLNNKTFKLLTMTDIGVFKEIVGKYSIVRKRDSCEITLGGP